MRTLLASLSLCFLFAPVVPAPAAPSKEGSAAAGKSVAFPAWFGRAKAGMFIHWGLYSIPGNEWKGKQGKRDAHLQQEFRIPFAEYSKLAEEFNPVEFDAVAWARLAKRAGLGYIVYVAKHHDGFAMFDSASNPYNIVKATPFRRDPLAELAKACQAEGLVLCVYYSLGRDWHVPGVPLGGYRCNDWDFPHAKPGDLAEYIEKKVKPQLRELLTGYGPIGAVWFDTPEQVTKSQSAELRDLIKGLQPDCLINARIGNQLGDYDIHEQRIPAKAVHRPWEACMTINRRWGFDRNDHQWKSPAMLVRAMIDVAAKGGNFLINIGPDGLGRVPGPSVDRLHAMGDWLELHGESVRGTGVAALPAGPSQEMAFSEINADGTEKNPEAGPGHREQALPRGWRATAKPGVLYIHLFDRPEQGLLALNGLKPEVARVVFLSDPARPEIPFATGDGKIRITLPEKGWNELATVVKIELRDPTAKP